MKIGNKHAEEIRAQEARVKAALQRPYPAAIIERMEATGYQDFGGIEGDALLHHFEDVMGQPWDHIRRAPLPPYAGLQRMMRSFGWVPPRERAPGYGANANGVSKVKSACARYKGVTLLQELAYGSHWRCRYCGPVGYPMHGSDELMHCPNADCDEVVDAALWVNREPWLYPREVAG